MRRVDGGLFGSFPGGRTGRGAKLPPQLGHTPLRRFSTQSRQRALERADHRVGGRWRQVYIAALAAWTKFEHSDAFLANRFVTSLSRYRTKLDVVHLLRLGGAGGREEAEIGSGRDIAGAHAHEFGGEVGARGKAADADMLAVLAARGN